MIIALLTSFVLGFIVGALVFRNNADKINATAQKTEDKIDSVITDIKK